MASRSSRRRCSSARRRASCSPICRTWLLSSKRSSGIDRSVQAAASGRLVAIGGAQTAQRTDVLQVTNIRELDELEAARARPLQARQLTVVHALLEPEIVHGLAHRLDDDGLADGAMRNHHDRLAGVRGHLVGEKSEHALLGGVDAFAAGHDKLAGLGCPLVQAARPACLDFDATLARPLAG